ncbi:MAG: C40 family peptidase [Acidimicrobiia bacterium]
MSEYGAAAVTARIAEIRSRFSSASARPNAASSVDFAGALARYSTTGTGATTGKAVVDIAKQWLGTPYVYGGNDPEKGIDCSGLVQQAYRRVGIELPRVTYDQVKEGTAVPDLASAQPGDLIFCRGDGNRVNGHVGIYIGNGQWIEAPYTGANVRITDTPKEISAIRRIAPSTPTSTGLPAGLAQLAAGLNSAGLSR